jgi:hypothetical protein
MYTTELIVQLKQRTYYTCTLNFFYFQNHLQRVLTSGGKERTSLPIRAIELHPKNKQVYTVRWQ